MTKISSTDKIAATDFPDQKSWIEKLLRPINQFMQDTILILNNGAQLSQNFVHQEFKTTLIADGSRTSASLLFRWTQKVAPSYVFVAQLVEVGSSTVPATGFTWQFVAGQVQCSITGLSSTKDYTLTIKGIA